MISWMKSWVIWLRLAFLMARKRWWGEELRRLRADYEANETAMKELALKYRTSLGQMARLARKHGFQPRRISKNNPKLSAMRARRAQLKARIDKIDLELRRLDSKIRFLEAVNSGNSGDQDSAR